MRYTRRFLVKSMDDFSFSSPIRYERYYINDRLRIQKKESHYEKEILDDAYDGLNRVEVEFLSKEEMIGYKKEPWMGSEITSTPLAFDKYLSKLTREQFLLEIKKVI